MPFIENHGIKIHYEIEGNGQPIVLLHGGGGRVKDWYNAGYVDALKDKFQLLLINMRGHGQSDKPHDKESYQMKFFADDVIAVMDDLQVEKSHFWGWSMGAYHGYRLVRHYPHRFHSFILGGAMPQKYGDEYIEQFKEMLALYKGTVEDHIAKLEAEGEVTDEQREVLRRVDHPVMYAYITAVIEDDDYWQGSEDALIKCDKPFLLYAGGKSEWNYQIRLPEIGQKLRNAKVLLIPDYGHSVGWDRSDLIIPHVIDFLEDVGQKL